MMRKRLRLIDEIVRLVDDDAGLRKLPLLWSLGFTCFILQQVGSLALSGLRVGERVFVTMLSPRGFSPRSANIASCCEPPPAPWPLALAQLQKVLTRGSTFCNFARLDAQLQWLASQ
jgi:hypothetical protein